LKKVTRSIKPERLLAIDVDDCGCKSAASWSRGNMLARVGDELLSRVDILIQRLWVRSTCGGGDFAVSGFDLVRWIKGMPSTESLTLAIV